MYYRTVVASALIRLLRLVTLAKLNDVPALSAISKIANYHNRDLTYLTEIHIFRKSYANFYYTRAPV
jgi:hypothetical protein